MLTPAHLDTLAKRDTSVVADALIGSSVLGTEVGDRFLSHIGTAYPERAGALQLELQHRGFTN